MIPESASKRSSRTSPKLYNYKSLDKSHIMLLCFLNVGGIPAFPRSGRAHQLCGHQGGAPGRPTGGREHAAHTRRRGTDAYEVLCRVSGRRPAQVLYLHRSIPGGVLFVMYIYI